MGITGKGFEFPSFLSAMHEEKFACFFLKSTGKQQVCLFLQTKTV